MKALRDREMTLWLLLLLAAVSILIYRIAFSIPVPSIDEEALRNLLAK